MGTAKISELTGEFGFLFSFWSCFVSSGHMWEACLLGSTQADGVSFDLLVCRLFE
jgi:hypothetical protein